MQLATCERHHRQQERRGDHDDDGDVLHDQGQFHGVVAEIQRSLRAAALVHIDRGAFRELAEPRPRLLPRELDALSGLTSDEARALHRDVERDARIGASARLATELASLASGEFTTPRSAASGAEREAPGRGAAGLRGEEAGGID